MTVVNPKSISGINSITTGSGSDNLLTIHTNDGTERVRVDSTGATKVGSGVTLSPDGDIFATGVTTSTTVQVGSATTIHTTGIDLGNGNLTGHNLHSTGITTSSSAIVGGGVTISESGIEASGIGITCANINGTQIGGRRNIIINGAMQIAQRGSTSTTDGYQTVDRFNINTDGTDEACTNAQSDVASGTTPYAVGLRKTLKITNGNQTSGAGAADNVVIHYFIEAIDMQRCGWNYTSSSSFITLSFYVKSSVAQTYFCRVMTDDGTKQSYPFSFALTADTWTRVIHTIPGNSNLQFDSNVNRGLMIEFAIFRGTDKTGSVTLNQWAAYDSSARLPDMTSTWYTTNDATFEITGLQLEVGSQATPFEHLSFGEDLILCQRYFYKTYNYNDAPGTADFTGTIHGRNYDGASARSDNPINVIFPVRMRADPTITWYAGDGQSNRYSTGAGAYGSNLTTENTVGTSFINSEIGVTAVSFSESVPALAMYAYHITAESEI